MGCCNGIPINLPHQNYLKKRKSDIFIPPTRATTGLFFQKANFIKHFYGSLFDKYSIIKQIGQGKFGYVYLANQRSTQILRAIKSINKSAENRQALNEIEMLKKLDHPNVVKVIEVIEQPNIVHISMELCDGGELFERIVKMGKISEAIAAKYMEDIIKTVAYCHGIGIVHRDLKPENIMFENEDSEEIKIVDFGCASMLNKDLNFNEPIGTVIFN